MFFVSKNKYNEKCNELKTVKQELEKEKQELEKEKKKHEQLLNAIRADVELFRLKNSNKDFLPITIELILKQEGR